MTRKIIYFIILTSFVRILFALPAILNPERAFVPTGDSYQYDRLAQNLFKYHRFSLDESPPLSPDHSRTPGYPIFIATFYGLFGPQPILIILIQIVITSLLCWMLYSLLAEDEKIASIACFLYALNPNIALYTSQILTEAIFMSIILTGITLLYKYASSPKNSYLIGISAIFAAGALTRPIGLYSPLFIAPFIFSILRQNLKQVLIKIPLFIGSFVIFIAPWVVRNYILFNGIFLSSIPTYDLLYFDAAVTVSAHETITISEARMRLSEELKAGIKQHNLQTEGEKLNYTTRLGIKYLFKYPWSHIKMRTVSALNCLIVPIPIRALLLYTTGKELTALGAVPQVNQTAISLVSQGRLREAAGLLWRERIRPLPLPGVLLLCFAVLYHLLMIVGIMASLRPKILQKRFVPLLWTTVAYFIILAGSAGHPRFRVPVEPGLIALAALGLGSKRINREVLVK